VSQVRVVPAEGGRKACIPFLVKDNISVKG